MNTRSIIKSVRDKRQADNQHIARITGIQYIPKKIYYRNIETGEAYYDLCGAIAFPAYQAPGFAVIVAVEKNASDDGPRFKVLDEIEDDNLEGLLQSCIQRRQRWGYPDLLRTFYGDPERFHTFLCDFNKKFQKDHHPDKGIYLAPPSDFYLLNRSEIYLERIKSFLKPDKNGWKRLILGSCNNLRTHLQNLPGDVSLGKIEDFPAAAALGYAVHSTALLRPWMRFVKHKQAIRTIRNDYEDYVASQQQEALYDLFSFNDRYDLEGGDDLIPTI
jgi:hypothetical protein